MARVPAKVPSPNTSAQTSAITRVGSVRISARMKRHTLTTTLLLQMFVEERIDTGSAMRQPMTVPRTDILMVSTRGPTTLLKKSHFGWKSFRKRSRSLSNFLTIRLRSKPVIRRESHTATTTSSRIRGVLLRRRTVEWPFGRVMTWGLKIRSNHVSFRGAVFSLSMLTLRLPASGPSCRCRRSRSVPG